ncbi:hypothetical protein ARMSODRAFT_1056832 [Armillaria solidipes]|uniref:Uncharacterized protein n=1 Tax=Armillaria solidipes TaxID=1076256 RepID=A0A2H3AZ36_9AGAR|nr:hypothetical protein ARMSODRAFT_1056832 [Armillaria solidipes]
MPSKEEVLPPAELITTQDRRTPNEVPVSKGQKMCFSYVYNSMPSIWSKDTGEWILNFLDDDKRRGRLGVCEPALVLVLALDNWRFAMMEIEMIIVELLRVLEFSLPRDGLLIRHYPGSQMVIPLVSGKTGDGAQVPLCVKVVERQA